MHVRALALALPLVLGIACKTSSTQSSGSSGKTATSEGSSAKQTPSNDPYDPASGVRAEEGTGTDAGNTSAAQSTTTSGAEIDKDKTVNRAAGSTAAAMGPTGGARDPLMLQDHQPIKAHASDRVLSGTISSAGSRSLSVKGDDGATTTLVIVPETSIVDKDGADVTVLHEGDQVHASYSQVQGDDIAVVIEVVPVPDTGSSGSTGATDSTGSTAPGEPKYPDATGTQSGNPRPGTDTH